MWFSNILFFLLYHQFELKLIEEKTKKNLWKTLKKWAMRKKWMIFVRNDARNVFVFWIMSQIRLDLAKKIQIWLRILWKAEKLIKLILRHIWIVNVNNKVINLISVLFPMLRNKNKINLNDFFLSIFHIRKTKKQNGYKPFMGFSVENPL